MAILPIVTYDDPVLRKEADPIEENSEELQQLIDDMFETMYHSHGVGLAAPQIGKLIRLYVVDADPMLEDEDTDEQPRGKLALINPEIIDSDGPDVALEEGCLSIPEVREQVRRPRDVTIRYLDRDFNERTLKATGWLSRVAQHELDHLNGVLFIDYLSAFRRRLIRGKLKDIDRGLIETDYPLVPKNNDEVYSS